MSTVPFVSAFQLPAYHQESKKKDHIDRTTPHTNFEYSSSVHPIAVPTCKQCVNVIGYNIQAKPVVAVAKTIIEAVFPNLPRVSRFSGQEIGQDHLISKISTTAPFCIISSHRQGVTTLP